ncbi:hypothetical protein [Sinorhizobium medicae]|uniref:hypothetical protein n=1 Tax=Sinorhizobium medicae TaxID=110321 RepID=UPI000FDA63C0|nr:hypothetical protein [Sinorhizobium medicae]RVP48139.1 hypothetical protein CN078_25695 [Sinorhizobium medicae]RVP75426.1 hypothetical protein CN079_20015 [Sinorhizobium medicae]UWU06600.1 hypothetical protein N2598_09400 [Sinorhizobium medicae]
MSSRPKMPPPGWAQDTLSSYLEEWRGNQWATFHNKRPEMSDFIVIDGLFDRLLNGAKDPKPMMPMTFLLRAHSAYRAAVSMVLGGQLYEAQALLRLCLEHASYGFFIGGDKARWIRWMKRNDSASAKDKVRKEFTPGAIMHALRKADAGIAGNFEFLYERLIDFGAHPNEAGFSMSTLLTKKPGETHISAVYLHGEGVPLDFALKTTAQVALCVLQVAYLIYPARMDLSGIRHDLDQITRGY